MDFCTHDTTFSSKFSLKRDLARPHPVQPIEPKKETVLFGYEIQENRKKQENSLPDSVFSLIF